MDRADAIRRLPQAYALAITLRDQGRTHQDTADSLDIPLESVENLLRLADAKLARILQQQPDR
jgi:DNA-directed RNA polymerase specialized sigma24 family protein